MGILLEDVVGSFQGSCCIDDQINTVQETPYNTAYIDSFITYLNGIGEVQLLTKELEISLTRELREARYSLIGKIYDVNPIYVLRPLVKIFHLDTVNPIGVAESQDVNYKGYGESNQENIKYTEGKVKAYDSMRKTVKRFYSDIMQMINNELPKSGRVIPSAAEKSLYGKCVLREIIDFGVNSSFYHESYSLMLYIPRLHRVHISHPCDVSRLQKQVFFRLFPSYHVPALKRKCQSIRLHRNWKNFLQNLQAGLLSVNRYEVEIHKSDAAQQTKIGR